MSCGSCFGDVVDDSEGATAVSLCASGFSVSKIALEFGSPNFEGVFGAVDFDLPDESASDDVALVEEVPVDLVAESFVLKREHGNILFNTCQICQYC